MIGYCFLGCVAAANHRRLKTEGKKYSRLVHFPLSSIMPLLLLLLLPSPHENQQCFEIHRELLPNITLHVRGSFELSADKRRPLLPWVQHVRNEAWHGASPLITSAHTHLCDDEPLCHPGQSSKLSSGSPQSYGISFAFFPNPPSSLPSLLSVLNCRFLSY